MVVQGTHKPRIQANNGNKSHPKVFCIHSADLKETFKKIETLWADHFSNLFHPDQQVLIKINLNTADPYPASTSPEMLKGLINLLHQTGINKIKIGDCSSISALPTKKVARKTGIWDVIAGKAEMVCFDHGPWVKVPIQGKYLKQATVPRIALEADRIIFLANLKTHHHADFSFGLKLGVGFLHPLERVSLHSDHLQEKVAEINLAISPDLVLIDGRTAFISGGPHKGRAEKGNLLMLGTNLLAVDVEAYRRLYSLKRHYGSVGGFQEDPYAMGQLRHGREMGLGGMPWKGYESIEG